MFQSFLLFLLFIFLIASICFYVLICYLIGEIALTNNILKQLLIIRFSRTKQKEIIKAISNLLDKTIKDELNNIASYSNADLMNDIGEDLTNKDINLFRDSLKTIANSEDPILDIDTITLMCRKLSLFSFIKNLNRVLHYLPLFKINTQETNKLKESKNTSNFISYVITYLSKQFNDKINSLIEPLINVKSLYDSSIQSDSL